MRRGGARPRPDGRPPLYYRCGRSGDTRFRLGTAGAWNEATYTYHHSRVFEHTSNAMSSLFSDLDGVAIQKLIALPSLFAYEQVHNEPASGDLSPVMDDVVEGGVGVAPGHMDPVVAREQ